MPPPCLPYVRAVAPLHLAGRPATARLHSHSSYHSNYDDDSEPDEGGGPAPPPPSPSLRRDTL